MKRVIFFLIFLFSFLSTFASADSCDIYVTTPGYTSIYRYSSNTIAQQFVKDFRVEGVTASYTSTDNNMHILRLTINRRDYVFRICDESPVARLQYDRNRRVFKGLGFNYLEQFSAKYTAPQFKGNSLLQLSDLWLPQIERNLQDRSLLKDDEPNMFLIEADIDEHGIVNKIVELTGALKQYSQVFIDTIYDRAVRGWQPATCNGVPFQTVAQIRFVVRLR